MPLKVKVHNSTSDLKTLISGHETSYGNVRGSTLTSMALSKKVPRLLYSEAANDHCTLIGR